MIMFVSQFYNKILWQSDRASVFQGPVVQSWVKITQG